MTINIPRKRSHNFNLFIRFLLFTLMSSIVSYGQLPVKPPTVLTFNLGSGVLSKEKGIPFDIPFLIEAPINDNSVEKILLIYQIDTNFYNASTKQSRYYFNPGNAAIKREWSNPKTSGNTMSFLVGPLHPNVPYDFKFTVVKSISVEKAKSDQLKSELTLLLKDRFENITAVDAAHLNTTATLVENKIKSALNILGKFVKKENTSQEFKFDPFAPPLMNTSRLVVNLSSNYLRDKNSFDLSKKLLIIEKNPISGISTPLIDNDEFRSTTLELKNIKDGITVLNTSSGLLVNRPINPTNPVFREYSLLDLFTILSSGSANDFHTNIVNNIRGIIEGSLKIENKKIIECKCQDEADLPSLLLIQSLFGFLEENKVLKQNGTKIFDRFNNFLSQSSAQLIKLTTSLTSIRSSVKEYEKITADFPDLFTDILIANSMTMFVQSLEDLESSNNVYVGLDFGFVYARGPIKNNPLDAVFLYQGVNIYLSQVNKDTPLSLYKGRDIFLKRFSLFFGLTQDLSQPSYENYEPFFKSLNSSLLVGGGFRISKAVRLNISELIYKQKNPNPLLNKSVTKFAPAFSVSFDINIAKAFGTIATRLKII